MICLDTSFLIHLWRQQRHENSAARDFLAARRAQEVWVPTHAAGEFLERGAKAEAQLEIHLHFLRAFRIGNVGLETALTYAQIVSELRAKRELAGRSKPDLWIAAWAVQHGSPLVTDNVKHFRGIPGLRLLTY